MGGGIFIYEALESAALEIDQSTKSVRHIVLFADAADSEEPGDYQRLLADLAAKKITVSVIGMGTPADPDAALLTDIARRGQGRISFADSAAALPRLFAEETITLSRAAFVDEKTKVALAGDLALLGPPDPSLNAPPQVGGYNLTYPKPGAGLAYRTDDENAAPLLALWQRGLGRVATFAAEADGPRAAQLLSWKGYRPLWSKVVRFVMAPPETADALVRVRREGHELIVAVEMDPVKSLSAGSATVSLLPGDGGQTIQQQRLTLVQEGRLETRFRLAGSGSFHPVVRLPGLIVKGPPATLPYAPEFEPQLPGKGKETLEAVAQISGGVERLSLAGLFDRGSEAPGRFPLAPVLVAAALLLMVVEVALRRFFFRGRTLPASAPREEAPLVDGPGSTVGTEAGIAQSPSVGSALSEARQRAKRRTGGR
jgi:hypothetical protein